MYSPSLKRRELTSPGRVIFRFQLSPIRVIPVSQGTGCCNFAWPILAELMLLQSVSADGMVFSQSQRDFLIASAVAATVKRATAIELIGADLGFMWSRGMRFFPINLGMSPGDHYLLLSVPSFHKSLITSDSAGVAVVGAHYGEGL